MTELTEQKQKAIECMRELQILPAYINKFKYHGTITKFEAFGGYYMDEDDEITKQIRKLEQEHGFLCYAVTHEFTEFGELYDLLIVSKYPEDWDHSVWKDKCSNRSIAFCYVLNKSCDWCSEFGDVAFVCLGDGIQRIQ